MDNQSLVECVMVVANLKASKHARFL